MNQEQIKLLNKMKKLIKEGKRRFISRPDRDYLEDLLDFGLTEEAAWENHILYLNTNFYFIDPKPIYTKDDNLTLTFKKIIDKKTAYIKLRLEKTSTEETVCLSFHEDNKKKTGGIPNEMHELFIR